MTNQSRRGFLAYLGLAGATTAAATAAVALAPTAPAKAERGRFKHPAEYLQAMQAIEWTPLAMFQRLDDGCVHRMGVNETAPSEALCRETWGEFHAIQMRTPVQLPADVHPLGDWWDAVWHHLYDHGFREDVTLPRQTSGLNEA